MSKISDETAHYSLKPFLSPDDLKRWNEDSLDSLSHLIFDFIKDDTITSPTTKISLFGLKSAKDVRTFLESPAGDTLMSAFANEASLQKAYQEHKLEAIQEQEFLKHFIKSSIILWELEKQAHASGQKDIILLLNQQAIARAKPVSTNTSPDLSPIRKAIANYKDALALNLALIGKNVKEGEELALLERNLLAQEKLIHARFELYIAKLTEFEVHFSSSPQDLEDLVSRTQKEMDEGLDQIRLAVEQNEDVKELIEAHQMLQFALYSYGHMMAINQKKKYYADESGLEVDSLEDAYYVLDNYTDDPEYQHITHEHRRSRVILEDGVYYLLQPGQSWDSIKDDEEAKRIAREDYAISKSHLLTPKNVLKLNYGRELQANREDLENLTVRKAKHQEEQAHLNNQAGILQAALASAQNCLNNPNLGLTAPRPTLTGASSGPKGPTPSYKAALKIEPQPRPQTEEELALRNRVNNYKGPNAEKMKLELRLMPMSIPIPPLVMQRMLQTMEAWGIDATKPAVTSIKNPLELTAAPSMGKSLRFKFQSLPEPVKVNAPVKAPTHEEEPDPKNSIPSALSTKPDPYKQ